MFATSQQFMQILLMVPPVFNLVEDVPNGTVISQDDFNSTTTNKAITEEEENANNGALLNFVILPLGIVVFLIIFIGFIIFLVRKKRLDKLRHHLMPLYSFDPAEEGEDWEAELLEEGTDHQPRGKNSRSQDQPQLSFRGTL